MSTPHSLQPQVHEIELSQALAALLVHLVWTDAKNWDTRRQLPRKEAVDWANRVADLLPEDIRDWLERMKD